MSHQFPQDVEDDAEELFAALNDATDDARTEQHWIGQPLISVKFLRTLTLLSKQQFDQAALYLAEHGLVSLSPHDYPAGLSKPDRAALIADGKTFYNGISLR